MADEERLIITPEDTSGVGEARVEGVSVPAGSLVLRPDDLGMVSLPFEIMPAFAITVEELVVPLTVADPPDGTEVTVPEIDIVGQTKPGQLLMLSLNQATPVYGASTPDGTFRFSKVKLTSGQNELAISVYEHGGVEGTVILKVHLRLPPYLGLTDWYTREPLTPNREVVRCSACKAYVLRDTWNVEGCYQGHKGNAFYTAEQAEFYADQDRVVRL